MVRGSVLALLVVGATTGCLSKPDAPGAAAPCNELAAAPFGTFVGGDKTKESNDDFHAAGLAEASSFLASGGTVGSLAAYYDGGIDGAGSTHDTATRFDLGLYDDSGVGSGDPTSLLATAHVCSTALLAPGWHAAATDSIVTLTAGAIYWIALLCPAGDVGCEGSSIEFPYQWLDAQMTQGPCDAHADQTFCTKHSLGGQLALPTQWTTDVTYTPSENSFFAAM